MCERERPEREREREREKMGDELRARLLEERKLWRRINAYQSPDDSVRGFYARPRENNLMIWECVVPGKGGTIFQGAQFPVYIDFSDGSRYDEVASVYVPEAFGGRYERHVPEFGKRLSCYDRVWDAYASKFKFYAGPRAPDISIEAILLTVQECRFNDNDYMKNKASLFPYRSMEEWKHIIAKYNPVEDAGDRGDGGKSSPDAVLSNTATSAVSRKRMRQENRNASTREKVPSELWVEEALKRDDYQEWVLSAATVLSEMKQYPNLRTPCLCLNWSAVRSNVDKMLKLVKCVENWRPHVKTTKMTIVWNLLLKKGVFKFKCSTIKELHYLLATIEHYEAEQTKETTKGKKKTLSASTKKKDASRLKYDVLYAHPLVSKEQCEDVRTLAMKFQKVKINVLIEAASCFEETTLELFRDKCLLNLTSIDDDGLKMLPNVGFFLDFSNGFDRTGFSLLDPSKMETTFFERLMSCCWTRTHFSGLSVYEGHIDDCVGYDANKLKAREMKWNIADEAILDFLKFHKEKESSEEVDKMMKANKTMEPIEIVTSGTPGFIHALDKYLNVRTGKMDLHKGKFYGREILRTVSPGTVVFFDHRSHTQICQQICDERMRLRPALYVAATVVSKPGKKNDRIFTCNAGSKSIAAEAGSPIAIVTASTGKIDFSRQSDTFWKQTKCSEEHLTFEVVRDFIDAKGPPPPVEKGETVLLVPRHVCPTVNLHECIHLIRYDERTHPVQAKVDARGHYTDPVKKHLDSLISLSLDKM